MKKFNMNELYKIASSKGGENGEDKGSKETESKVKSQEDGGAAEKADEDTPNATGE